MRKKTAVTIMTMILILTGCGSKVDDSLTITASSQESVETTEETQETEPGKETEATKETQESSQTSQGETKENTASNTEKSKESTGSSQAVATNTKKTETSKSSQESKSKTESSQAAASSQGTANKPSTGSGSGNTKPSVDNNTGNTGTGNGGTTSTPKPSHTTCTWDGGKVTSGATCNSEGVKTYTCTVCGKTKTEGIAKTAHNYVSQTTPPTCTEAGKVKTTCSICGNVQSETAGAAAAGHKMVDSWFGDPPTCNKGGYLNRYCTVCDFLEVSTSVPPLEHVKISTETHHGNCMDDTIIVHSCSVCNEELGFDRHNEPNEHSWEWGETSVWDPEKHEMVMVPFERCSRCGTSK